MSASTRQIQNCHDCPFNHRAIGNACRLAPAERMPVEFQEGSDGYDIAGWAEHDGKPPYPAPAWCPLRGEGILFQLMPGSPRVYMPGTLPERPE